MSAYLMVLDASRMVLDASRMVLDDSIMALVALPHVDVLTIVPASVNVDESTVKHVHASFAVTAVEDGNDLIVALVPDLVPVEDLVDKCIDPHE